MKESIVTDRLVFLAENFDVFEIDKKSLKEKHDKLKADGFIPISIVSPKVMSSDDYGILGLVSVKVNKKERCERRVKKISVSSNVFADMIAADPSENKEYLQWMLNVFARLLRGDKEKDNDKESIEAAIRFVSEDLPQANTYLTLFNDNKRKKKFLDLCNVSYSIKGIKDPTDINQYKSLSQLFDAVDPFIEKEPSSVERVLNKFVELGQAIIPVKDRHFTLYIPKSTAASIVFDKFANWCTAKVGNGMFNSYTTGHKKPNGKNSDIYIIIDNNFFAGKTDKMFQIHFETNQIKDRQNGSNISIFEEVINKSEGISNFFYEELMGMAKGNKKGIEDNLYLEYLIKFGFADSLFEFLEEDTPTIRFMKREIPKLPDLTRFKSLDMLIITDAKLSELHPSIGNLINLELLSLANNRLKSIPREIGSLKKLLFINLVGNSIESIPSEITYLDKSKGGSLHRIGVKKEEIGEDNYQKLKELLPETQF